LSRPDDGEERGAPTRGEQSPPWIERAIETAIVRIGDAVSWIWLALMFVIVLGVILRYVFGAGRIEVEELQWHLYAIGFLVGLSVCVSNDSHVRVDVLREHIPPRMRAWIELYGLLLLVLPFVALILIYGAPFVVTSFVRGEISPSPGGLPYRWIIKGALFGGFGLVAAAAVARISRVWRELFGGAEGPGASSQGGAS